MSTSYISSALRQRVMATFQQRCVYCQTSQQVVGPLLEIDHIIPESKGGINDEANLCSACPMCNSHKATHTEAADPESGLIVPLFNPRTEVWTDHFEWREEGVILQDKQPRVGLQSLYIKP